jgi:type I restriction enzyme S subunit
MTTWSSVSLGTICAEGGGTIRTGPFGSQLHDSDYATVGTPVVMPKDIVNGRVSEATIARVGEEHVRRLAQHQLSVGDIVYGRRGDIGRRALVTATEAGWLCGTGCLRISPDSSVVEPRFLFYALGHPATTEAITKKAVGATMLNLNTTILREVQLLLPDLLTQERIASILGAYDDLIEVNRRRIAFLEEMARRLFEDWFVHFRLPGYVNTSMTPASEGPLPAGWSWQPLHAICERPDGIQTGPFGSQLHQSDYTDEGVPVVMPKNIIGLRVEEDDIARIPEALAEQLGRHRMRTGDVVYGRRGDIGRRAYISSRERGWFCGTGCLRFRPDQSRVAPRYFFDALGLPVTFGAIKARAQGATMPNLSAGAVAGVPVMVPAVTLQKRYSATVEPLAQLQVTLADANARLSTSRDFLLPRLISGELSVAVVERELEAAA